MHRATKDHQVSACLPSQPIVQEQTDPQLKGCAGSAVATEVLSDDRVWRAAQIWDLKLAVAAADAGKFASDSDVRALAARYVPGRRPAGR